MVLNPEQLAQALIVGGIRGHEVAQQCHAAYWQELAGDRQAYLINSALEEFDKLAEALGPLLAERAAKAALVESEAA